MKTVCTIIFCVAALLGYGQNWTVSTFMESDDANVTDALALDSEGNLFGSDFYGTDVYMITPDGAVSSFVTGMANPNGLAFDSEDNLFVVEYGGAAINKFDHDGNLLETYTTGDYPSGLVKAYRSDAMIFTTADFGGFGSNGVFRLNTDGTIDTIYVGDPIQLPVGLTYGPGGVLYIGDYWTREIFRITRQGEIEYVATVPAPNNYVPYLAFITYSQGFLYGTIYGENKIYKIDPRGVDVVEEFSGTGAYGGTDGPIDEATYIFPSGILANKSGNVMYLSEFSSAGNIRKIVRGDDEDERIAAQDRSDLRLPVTVSTFPNPVADQLNIRLSGLAEGAYSITVFDLLARKVFESRSTAGEASFERTIPVAEWETGVYQVVITQGAKKFATKVLVE